MLRLKHATGPAWLAKVLPALDELLLEQAHLEKKAASGALTFMFRYVEHEALQAPLSELAREELEHFEQSLAVLRARGIPFRRQRPGPYAERLLAIQRVAEPGRMLDQMLCAAVIEARSCERMKLLADGLSGQGEDELAAFYRRLVVSEARHHGLYVRLAKTCFEPAEVERRLDEILDHEADVLSRATALPRLHN
ncbi:MAG: tRNA-(ms[2]io[6]A)-hydroxylase [Planctomycetes bacterium]|nr:tRNA-(ms[2]io[6]A)-hydroxylase [Planctomycetota bacterium]